MKNVIENFFAAFFKKDLQGVFTPNTPKEMMASEVDEYGWFFWKPIKGALTYEDYEQVEKKFNVSFPKSFIEWHKSYFFLDGDFMFVSLPSSLPTEPLSKLTDELDYDLAKELIEMKLYPFGSDGIYIFVFDAREDKVDNEFPIRVYDHDFYDSDSPEVALGEIVFSSFSKLLECLTYFLNDEERPIEEVIPEFFKIDPEGAGKTGRSFWMALAQEE